VVIRLKNRDVYNWRKDSLPRNILRRKTAVTGKQRVDNQDGLKEEEQGGVRREMELASGQNSHSSGLDKSFALNIGENGNGESLALNAFCLKSCSLGKRKMGPREKQKKGGEEGSQTKS